MTNIQKIIQEGKRHCDNAQNAYVYQTAKKYEGTLIRLGAWAQNNLPILFAELERLQGERDAAVELIPKYCFNCKFSDQTKLPWQCANEEDGECGIGGRPLWQWHGPQQGGT